MQNLPIPSMAALPVTMVQESLNIVGTILNHSAKMKQIDNNYHLAKQQMQHAYDIEIQRIEKDMFEFETTVNLYSQNSQNMHIERMKILDQINELTLKIFDIKDSKIFEGLSSRVDKLLATYEKNCQQNIHFLESTASSSATKKLLN